MKRTIYILELILLLLILTLLGKVEFLFYNRDDAFFTLHDVWVVLWQGLPMDLSTIAMLVFPVWVYVIFTLKFPRMKVRKFIGIYLCPIVFVASIITCANLIMYENWKFPLDASVFSYMTSPGNAGASASFGYLCSRIGLSLLVTAAVIALVLWITPHRIVSSHVRTKNIPPNYGLLFLLTGTFMAFMVWGINGKRADERSAFHSETILLNHASLNPVGHMINSIWLYGKSYDHQFNYLSDQEAEVICRNLYPRDTDDLTDMLLTTAHPNVLTIQLESFGSRFMSQEVTPNLLRWADKGVYFDNAWAASFRTDRGTVCALSGMPPYPTISLMMTDSYLPRLNSLARVLHDRGYSTNYLYGSNAERMNKQKYLLATGFEKVWDLDDLNVPEKERTVWGANDSTAFQRTMQLMLKTYNQGNGEKPFYWGMQTIDSHEPFDVPYDKFNDRVLNAFAYTDHCLGWFLDELSRTELWQNLVVVVYADHGHMHGITEDNPQFFKMPLLITGGAVKSPRRIHTIISQSDIVGTLLAQLNIPHSKDFPWSRNVFSRNYTHPSAYCTTPNEAMFVDVSGITVIDIQSLYPVYEADDSRTKNIKAILQHSYSQL